jgi:hypothetical protein
MQALGTFKKEDYNSCDMTREFSTKFGEFKQTEDKVNHLKEYFAKSDLFTQIFISKNILRVCPAGKKCVKLSNPDCRNLQCAGYIFNLFDIVFAKDLHRYIRRPMAREDTVTCLLTLYSHAQYKEKATSCIISLIKDEDEIISTTAFDYIHQIYERGNVYRELCEKIITYAAEESTNTILATRAKHVRETLLF